MLKQINKSYCCVGLMSGTSLDGLDIALCNLSIKDGKWSYSFVKTASVKYDEEWKDKLSSAVHLNGYELIKLHRRYGTWLGEQVKAFLQETNCQPECIASHGHTVFHEPHKGLNFQLGDGASLAAAAGMTTVNDFRSLDICMGGQGAPLVPIGDHLLFSEFDACVNLGGFANLSTLRNKQRVAWDICPANYISNKLVQPLGMSYDDKGEMGQKGEVIEGLLKELNGLSYYTQSYPKSLGQEWVESFVDPILKAYRSSRLPDILRSYYEHVSSVIANDLKGISGDVLFTGGGVYNSFLMDLLAQKLVANVIIPEKELIDFKEALLFAFLGALRMREENNCLASVSGAKKDNCSGTIHLI